MINITLPDGSKRAYAEQVTALQIAQDISPSLAKMAIAAQVNDEKWDVERPIEQDAKVAIITTNSADGIEIIRHDAAHIMAQAVKELYPDTQVTIGPAIENGFYYDFARAEPFSIEDLTIIEKRMQEISKRDDKIVREVWQRDEAIEFFEKQGEKYKAEIISAIPQNENITLYRQGDFIDLCRGPHAPSTGKIKYFKLMKVAGAYWRGDENREMLQRVYATAWKDVAQLKHYQHIMAEAKKRDHRVVGKKLDLFSIQESWEVARRAGLLLGLISLKQCAEFLVFGLKASDLIANRHKMLFKFFESEPPWDVLRAVPAEGLNRDNDRALRLGGIPVNLQALDELRVLINRHDLDAAPQLEASPVRIVHHNDRAPIVAGQVANAQILPVPA